MPSPTSPSRSATSARFSWGPFRSPSIGSSCTSNRARTWFDSRRRFDMAKRWKHHRSRGWPTTIDKYQQESSSQTLRKNNSVRSSSFPPCLLCMSVPHDSIAVVSCRIGDWMSFLPTTLVSFRYFRSFSLSRSSVAQDLGHVDLDVFFFANVACFWEESGASYGALRPFRSGKNPSIPAPFPASTSCPSCRLVHYF